MRSGMIGNILASLMIAAIAFLAAQANAATVTYLGIDSTTGPAWRSTDVSKSGVFDPSGDNAYGTDGCYYPTGDYTYPNPPTNTILSEPAYISSIVAYASYYYSTDYVKFDDPSEPIGPSVTDISNGLFYNTGTKFTFTVTEDSEFILAVLVGAQAAGIPVPSSITVEQTAGTGSGTATTTSSPTIGPSYVFFNIAASAGDSFKVDIVASSTAGIVGLGFESAVIAPPAGTVVIIN